MIITEPLNHARVPRVTVTSARGVPFLVLFDPATEMVEFWDLRCSMPHFSGTERARMNGAKMPGRFTGGRYIVTTLIGGGDGPQADHNEWRALDLGDGSEPDWRIDSHTMHLVRQWLRFTRFRAAEQAPAAPPAPDTGQGKRVAACLSNYSRENWPRGTITGVDTDTNEITITWDQGGSTPERYEDLGKTWVYASGHGPDEETSA